MDGPNVNKKFYEDFITTNLDIRYWQLLPTYSQLCLQSRSWTIWMGIEKVCKRCIHCVSQFSSSSRRLWKCQWLFLVSFKFVRNTVSMFACWLTNTASMVTSNTVSMFACWLTNTVSMVTCNTISMFACWLTNDTRKNDWKQNSDDSNWTGEW